jgi:hypothetical protein
MSGAQCTGIREKAFFKIGTDCTEYIRPFWVWVDYGLLHRPDKKDGINEKILAMHDI